ncbi:hypothetical protein [Microbispora bryophytorum]|uniref:Uncharacterized protein n=1 Tax=Microbispora bryophytorum subsp. camponoti TaxID=1677852 RepID=A0ABR8LCP8_9ACTN|nr:hypothetical protein [Microbispora camponoti]MBD3146218.1 hypothetical protein [Microbispora camponoti]
MTTITGTTAHLDDSRTREAFDLAKKCVALSGMICGITLATVAVLSIADHMETPFMWVRAVILLAIAPMLHRMIVRASQGSRRSFDRMRTISVTMPIAIIGVDLIPGICPAWYAVMQAMSVLPLVAVAFILNGSGPRAAFPKTR